MRRLHLDDRCTLRFPSRPADYVDGVEMGILAAHMEAGLCHGSRRIAVRNLTQARVLASRFNWHLIAGDSDGETIEISIRRVGERVRLKVVDGSK